MASMRKWDFPYTRKFKTAVKFHYYTYPRKNDHECFTHFAFVHLLFSKWGNVTGFTVASWFSYGRFSVGGGVFGRGKSHPN